MLLFQFHVHLGVLGADIVLWTLKFGGMIGAGTLIALACRHAVVHVQTVRNGLAVLATARPAPRVRLTAPRVRLTAPRVRLTVPRVRCKAGTPCSLDFSADFNVHNRHYVYLILGSMTPMLVILLPSSTVVHYFLEQSNAQLTQWSSA